MTKPVEIIEAVREEREKQDKYWGTIEQNPHTLIEWIVIMENKLTEAKKLWLKPSFGCDVRYEIIKCIAVGFACLEQHEIPLPFIRGVPSDD